MTHTTLHPAARLFCALSAAGLCMTFAPEGALFAADFPPAPLFAQSANSPEQALPEVVVPSTTFPAKTTGNQIDHAAAEEKAKNESAVQFVFQLENDGQWANYFNGADRHYTSGARVTMAFHPEWAYDVARALPLMDSSKTIKAAAGFFVGQDFYTPIDNTQTAPIPNDWPYAGWLYGGVFFQRSNDTWMDHFQFVFGMTGPSSLARQTQDAAHELTGNDYYFEGWSNQLRDEPNFNFNYERRWRALAHDIGENWGLDITPHAGLTLGSANRNVVAGATGRIGINLDKSFGPGSIGHAMDFTNNANLGTAKYSFFVFGRLEARYVQHNMFLQGNNWSYSQGVDIEPFVGEGTFGVGLNIGKHVELLISNTYLTQEFKGQTTHDSYGTYQVKFNMTF